MCLNPSPAYHLATRTVLVRVLHDNGCLSQYLHLQPLLQKLARELVAWAYYIIMALLAVAGHEQWSCVCITAHCVPFNVTIGLPMVT